MVPYINNVFVDLVGKHIEVVVPEHHLGQCLQFVAGVDATGRIAGRTEDEHACARGDGGFELLGSDLEVLLDAGTDVNRHTSCQQRHLWVAHPVRRGDDDLLAIVDKSHHSIADTLLGTIRNENLVSGVVESVLVLQLGDDGAAQVGIARHRRVARPVVVDSLLGCLLDVVGSIEVGFSHAEVDHIDALCLHLGTFLRHRESG